MYEELDELLGQSTTDDAWNDDGYLLAQDILNDFTDKDWELLTKEIQAKDKEWQKKLIYCIDNQLIEKELNVICKLLQVQDEELFEMCVDTLRSYDNEIGHSFIKQNPYIIQMAKDRIKKAGNIEKMMLENFISKFEES
ncbi:hypothetical protein [Butyrivibrio sp. INlla21]|uniref:hypothetical protein n=1 Tax=Butyrivibrio sp. INlla21 TaxID=1520811 RepID=UPI0008E3A6BB|nr:hypothetical protein [Butyrivibrio sp. INlla21]SFU76937.1 hypothetical protein SAMN02910342_01684 [Butyrivibrio sp. INlla21]